MGGFQVRGRWVAAGAVVVLAAAGTTAVVLRPEVADLATPAPTTSPEAVRTPLLAEQPDVPAPTAAGVRRALTAAARDRALGTLGLSVVDAETGQAVLELGADRPATPASTAKIVTAVAALSVLDPGAALTTRLVQGAPGDLVLVGGGDPSLVGAHPVTDGLGGGSLAALAGTAKGRVVKRVVVDDSLFTGPTLGPSWKPGYVTGGDVAPVGALMVDGGRESKEGPRAADPALAAGRQLAALLHVKTVVRGRAPAGAVEVGHVESAPVERLVEAMLTRSDNDLAEALGRQVALATKGPASFAGEVAATQAALEPLLRHASVSPSAFALHDASGLSPKDTVQPGALSRLLAAAAQDPRFGPLLSGLPVAGFDGTLAKRYRTSPAAGEVRAKTGTLNGVSALAGLVRTRDGAVLAFAFTANGIPLTGTLQAQAALDRLATVLAACGCR
jgi:D-alanyl-D-alanine carboxypeptidase/D-alanyl-D-alanine-endopeptidase (penicillin-binding protein 4)